MSLLSLTSFWLITVRRGKHFSSLTETQRRTFFVLFFLHEGTLFFLPREQNRGRLPWHMDVDVRRQNASNLDTQV